MEELLLENKLVMTCCPLFSKKRDSSANRTVGIHEEVSGIQNTKLFTYRELQFATDNFNGANKIGEGGFGSVYKGQLRDGTMAAVKVLSADSRQGVREFLTEIDVIADIEHKNLVKLHGCCVEGNHRILVYGYLENNSLARTLLGGHDSSIQFNWETRYRICIGVAKGLVFLHEEVQPHVVHRDIKASNILLDKNLDPKISDFGLAKLFPDHLTHVSTRVAGTAGYLAPEYAIRGQLTRKADIYSFGVLTLEIVSGRANMNKYLPVGDQSLLERAWKLYVKGELLDLVDKSLCGDYNAEEARRFLKIGLMCTQEETKRRPYMSVVVKMLMGEIAVEDDEISRPCLLPCLFGKNISDTMSDGAAKQSDSSSSSGNIITSYATMTFNSIYDRSN